MIRTFMIHSDARPSVQCVNTALAYHTNRQNFQRVNSLCHEHNTLNTLWKYGDMTQITEDEALTLIIMQS